MEINNIGPFSDNIHNISKEYDFNKDGTVDIQDYHFALLSLEDDDASNDIIISKDELDKIFADLKTADDKVNPDTLDVTADNVNSESEKLFQQAQTGIRNPEEASTFEELQTIGQNLSKIIKRATKLLPVLNEQIDLKNEELARLQEEKDKAQEEYEKHVDKVERKSDKLNENIIRVLEESECANAEIKNNSNAIIKNCIQKYKDGDYKGQDLFSVISSELAGLNPSNASLINNLLSENNSLGNEIRSLCMEIENIVGNIRNITIQFNDITANVNMLKENKNNVLDSSNRASAEYQKGYQKRADLRQAYVNKFAEEYGMGISGMEGFLDNIPDIPFADAFAILKGLGEGTGITFGYGSIRMPSFSYPEGDANAKKEAEKNAEAFSNLEQKIANVFGPANNSVKTGNGTDTEEPEDVEDFLDEDTTEDEFLAPSEAESFQGYTGSSSYSYDPSDPISFTKDGFTNHFIVDRDGDGIFDNEEEFLGAEKGWQEMKAYDKDKNGIIEGDELEDLKMVSVNDTTGQFTFRSAEEAGIESIDLSTYNREDKSLVNGDILRGNFEIEMTDGTTVKGEHTDDYLKNISFKYANLFGAEIKDLDEEYKDNIFMEEFIEKINTQSTVASSQSNIEKANRNNENKINSAKRDSKTEAQKNIDESEKENRKLEEKNKLKENDNDKNIFF